MLEGYIEALTSHCCISLCAAKCWWALQKDGDVGVNQFGVLIREEPERTD
jgi:hypothetical protein